MSAATILTLANGKSLDLLNVKADDIDLVALAEHLAKEKRFNGATPNVEYSVAQHLSIGSDAILKDGGTDLEAAYFLLHDAQEAIWKDDPTPKKVAIATRVSERCGIVAADILAVIAGIVSEHDAAIHQSAGLPWPVPEEIARIVHLYDAIMFVTEWRDLMGNIEHPNWSAYTSIRPLPKVIDPEPWPHARAGWLYRARRLLPSLRTIALKQQSHPRLALIGHLAHGKTNSMQGGSSV